MFVLIGIWGSRERKIRAVYLLFFYTLFGSLLMLIGLLYIYSITGTLNLEYLLTWPFTFEEQSHVEAPTVGSVLLAGILLKLGKHKFFIIFYTLFGSFFFSFFCIKNTYVSISYLVARSSFYFQKHHYNFSPFVYLLSVLGVIYASLSAIRQTDLKRIIAYSSVAHMNLVTLGIFSFNTIGIEGSILQSISHGFVSGAMFLLVGILYDRYHSRFLYYYGGLVHMMPVYAVFLLIFTMANIALPGTSSFVGEFLLLLGIYKTNILSSIIGAFRYFYSIIGALGVILCGAYSLWLYNRIIFGNLKTTSITMFKDINLREFIILLPLLILVLFMGVYPSFFSEYIHLSVCSLSLVTFY
eukprot:GSChrysophyteH1.ASY1.ANO1.2908.1 assembled CDS